MFQTWFTFFVQQLSESEQSEGETDTKLKKAVPPSDRKYIPPKIAAVHYGNVCSLFITWEIFMICSEVTWFVQLHLTTTCPLDGDMTGADKKAAQAERQRRAALRSSVIQELRQQYSDAPEEIRERRDFQSEREGREELHRYDTRTHTLSLKH